MTTPKEQPEQFKIRVKDLPSSLLDSVANFVSRFSTPLILNDSLAGSGTFIKCGRTHGILTAHHVVHNPKDRSRRFDFSWISPQRLGLPLVNRPHLFDLPMRSLVCVDVGVPTDEYSGPDLAVLILPESEIGKVTGRMSFVDISVKREERLAEALAPNGLWAVAGSPAYCQRTLGPSHGFGTVVDHPCAVAYAAIGERADDGEFDFLHLNFHASSGDEMPSSFEGMSGGGVWKLRLQQNRETLALTVDFNATILAGVCFYEILSQKKPEALRCHGGKSIYQKVYEKLTNVV